MSLAPEHPAPPELPEVPAGVTPGPQGPRWHPATALAGFVAAFVTAAMLGSILLIASGTDGDEDAPAWANIAATVVQDVVLVSVAIGFAAFAARPRPWQFGLNRATVGKGRLVGFVVLAYVAFVAFTAVWISIVGGSTEDELPQDLGVDESTAAAVGIGILVVVFAPLVEEFFFRGYLYGALRTWRGPAVGAVVVGVLFGAVHAGGSDVAYLLPLAVFGGVLCVLRERTGSLYPCIVLHAINNSIAFGSSMDWGWETPVVLVGALATIAAVLALVKALAGSEPAHAPARVG
ncbi:CPBP family intramembrane glutamic endopeptidase [Conexibacter sp. SYSU D00693]|uniref:CPBP family intramembrane glutamic endopeptidase n=1 Tax=Conexibacter sp. SYSU D00693 TaxID=2812560 RepID=UPI00196A342A|nr:type II CAAX endopeptidase family protein [Conexibacter sp. SYSU D00693]